MMRAPRPRPRRAFSLVEVLVGVAVLLAGFVPVYFFMFRAERGTIETQRSVEALLHAETLLEEIAHLPYHAIPSTGGKRLADADYRPTVAREFRGAFAGDGIPPGAGFERGVEVIESGFTKRIKVSVVDRRVEPGAGGRRGEIFLSTLIAR